MAVAACFESAHGMLEGTALEMETTTGGSVGCFVRPGDGEYIGYLISGWTGSQFVESANCAGGYALNCIWTGELQRGSASR